MAWHPLICDRCGGQMQKIEENLFECEDCHETQGEGHL